MSMLPPTAKLVSADDHVIEPARLWVDRVPEKYKDSCPRIVEVDGREAWSYNGSLVYTLMGSCRAREGYDEQGYPPAPGTARYDEMRPGCYDPVERLKDMDIDNVYGQLCFPNYARFAGHRFVLGINDNDLALACTQAYNDYLIDEWCATDPERLFGAVILPLHDIDLAVEEFKRVIDKGAKALAFSENPTVLGLPSVHTDHWDALWALADEAEIPVCMHIGSSSKLLTTSDDAPIHVMFGMNGINSFAAGMDWMFSGILDRFANLKIVLSEGGAGWVPYALERADKVFRDNRFTANESVGMPPLKTSTLPSQQFAEHMYVCLVDEEFALHNLDFIPAENLLWEGDFPHGDGLWPHNRDYLDKALAGVPDDIATMIAETNMRKLLKI
jgi:predicted TIM-barrel fold metal-dependent hydrolase